MRTHPLKIAGLILATLWVAGCSSRGAYVDRDFKEPLIQKPKIAGSAGSVRVCYGTETPLAEVDALAKEACAYWGLDAEPSTRNHWQCSLTAPHVATYGCVDRSMKFANGSYVNPFDKASVEQWRDEQINGPKPAGRKARAAAKAAKEKAAGEEQPQDGEAR